MGAIGPATKRELEPYWLSKAKREIVLEIIRQGEARIQAQIDLAKASDARAMGLLTASCALAGGAVAVIGTLVSASKPPGPVIWAGMAAVLGLFISAYHAARSAWPRDVQPLGWHPSDFMDDVASQRPLNLIYCDLANSIERRLQTNSKVISECGQHTKASILGLPLAIGSSILTGLLELLTASGTPNLGGASMLFATTSTHILINHALKNPGFRTGALQFLKPRGSGTP